MEEQVVCAKNGSRNEGDGGENVAERRKKKRNKKAKISKN
jgi:hypothetical protein